MAWLEQRGDQYHAVFRLAGQKFKRSLKTADAKEAERLLERIARRIRLARIIHRVETKQASAAV